MSKLRGVIRANRFAQFARIGWFARIGNSSDSGKSAWRAIKIGVSSANDSGESNRANRVARIDSPKSRCESPVPLSVKNIFDTFRHFLRREKHQKLSKSFKNIFRHFDNFRAALVFRPLLESEPIFGKGMRRSTFQWRKGFFGEKGGGNSVNKGFGKDFYRKGNQWRASGHSLNRRNLKTQKLLSSSPSRKSALISGPPKKCEKGRKRPKKPDFGRFPGP